MAIERKTGYLRWYSGPVTRLARAQRAARLARVMAPCRLGSGRCRVQVLFALLITETSELGVSWRLETDLLDVKLPQMRDEAARVKGPKQPSQRGKTSAGHVMAADRRRGTRTVYCQQADDESSRRFDARPHATLCDLERRPPGQTQAVAPPSSSPCIATCNCSSALLPWAFASPRPRPLHADLLTPRTAKGKNDRRLVVHPCSKGALASRGLRLLV
jgi:hypothetical protein